MDAHEALLARRLGLIRGSRILLGAALLGAAGTPITAVAAKADKRDFYYQDKPKDGKSCASCRQYSEAPGGRGYCALVEGEVSPSGWCLAYSPKG
jgi:hypothetical protein